MGELMKTQVGIIGAGPAGLLVARILQLNGIDSVILERRTRAYVLERVRAGVLESGTVDTLRTYGMGERLNREGIPMRSMQLCWDRQKADISLDDGTGRHLTTYGQQKIVEDLILQREADGLPIVFEADVSRLDGIEDAPRIHYRHNGEDKVLECQFIAGCDGYHGVSRRHIPGSDEHVFLTEYPFAWLGILAEAAPLAARRGFAHSTRGLAVASARSASVGRLYLQVEPDADPNAMSDQQIWDELDIRMDDGTAAQLNRGPIIERSVARLRGYVCEKMRHGRLAIAGDAAHIVPPSGGKGLNLAVGDARIMAEAIRRLLTANDTTLLDSYSEMCLRRIWPTVHWACSMCEALHIFPGQTSFQTRMQYQTLNHWGNTEIGQQRLRKAQLGLPYEI
jgi:p-hydroxybenzoate 3-monooxygenase